MKNPLMKRLPRELKNDFAKYFVIFAFMVMLISLVSGFLVADNSVSKAYWDGFEKYKLEWGHLTFDKEPTAELLENIEKKGNVTLYDLRYFEEDTDEKGQTIRTYEVRDAVNTECLMTDDSKLPTADDEIALDRMFAHNAKIGVGDTIKLAGRSLKVVGLIAIPDYSCLYENNSDMMFDAVNFSIAVMTKSGFEKFGSHHIKYNYAFMYNDEPADDEAQKEASDKLLEVLKEVIADYDTAIIMDQAEDLAKAFLAENPQFLSEHPEVFTASEEELLELLKQYVTIDESNVIMLSDYLPRFLNHAIMFTGEDMGKDKVMFTLFDYIVVAILAFVFAVTISNTIAQEAGVIGTLRASGYTRGEIVVHYMMLPVVVTLLAAIVGNILGYTVMKNMMADMYYTNYSLSTYETLWNAEAFLDTTVIPVILMFVINWAVLASKMKLSPLKFLRRDLSKKQKKKAFRLNTKIPFIHRFRLRILFQNIPNYITLIIGIIFAGTVVIFGLMFGPMLDDYAELIEESVIAKYQYVLAEPAETAVAGVEKYCTTSLESAKEEYAKDDILIYGIENGSQYVDLNLKNSMTSKKDVPEVYVSNGMIEKFGYKVGEEIELAESFTDNVYRFKIAGVYQYDAALAIFMSREDYLIDFEKNADYYTGYFSNSELNDIDEKLIYGVITEEDYKKVSTQLSLSMGNFMSLFQIFGVLMFVLLMFLLSKQVIEKNANSIAMVKILGFYNGEIGGLYILATSVTVLIGLLVAIPIVDVILHWAFTSFIYTLMPGYIPYIVSSSCYVKMVLMGVVCYAVVAVFQMIKINKIPKAIALKNVE